ncbi:MAG: ABC transporter permease subunit, partial [Eubacteriales bacterium]|nr:ABC transporter permease subunit [Eubacteriales bacterium]
TIHDQTAMKYFPDAQRVYTPGSSDLVAALTLGKIDGYLVDQPQGYAQCLSDDRLWMPDVRIEEDHYGIALAFGQEALCEQLNALIGEMKAAGELDALSEKWFLTDEGQKPMAALPAAGEHGVLKLATSADSYPFSYMREGQAVGYSVELFGSLCAKLGYGCEVQVYDFGGMIAAVAAGKADAASDSISITAERKEQMLFTDPTYDGGVVMVLSAAQAPQSNSVSALQLSAYFNKERKLGVKVGTTHPDLAKAAFPEVELVYLNTLADLKIALESGKIDGYLVEKYQGLVQAAEDDKLWLSDEVVKTADCAIALAHGQEALRDEMNAALANMRADGTMDALEQKWLLPGDDAAKVMEKTEAVGTRGVLKLATDTTMYPFAYMKDGKPAGYEIDLFLRLCDRLGYAGKIESMNFAGVIAAVSSGKADVAACSIAITPERSEQMLFTDSTFSSKVMVMLPASLKQTAASGDTQGDAAAQSGLAAAWASISASFERTFLRENRWMLIVQGLLTTLQISVLSALLGTLLGFGVCMMRRSRLRVLSGAAKVFVALMQGTPIVVFLMILYYIVFGDVDPILVAVIGFGLNFAAYVSEMMRTGIDAVDKGQIEAASAIGFTRVSAFALITLPQAARHFLPVFRGEFISLVKMTSVVGYISIMDLTKMSDIIRSRTYEAFFPLIATAVIYFALSWLLARVLTTLEKRIDPKRRKRAIKGVREEESAC